jgi:hypothetical protein
LKQHQIILLGMPRSGTSWIGKIFDSHPDTLYRHEPDSAYPLREVPLLPAGTDPGPYRETLDRFVDSVFDMRMTKVAASVPVFPKHYLSGTRQLMQRGAVKAVKLAAKLVGELQVPDSVDYRAIDSLVVVWKSIESTGRIGILARAFPTARLIHIVRHPCGFAASVLRGEARKKFSSGTPVFEDWGLFELTLATEQARRYGLSMELIRSFSPAQRLAWRWVIFNEKAMDDAAGLPNVRQISYESVCVDASGKSRALFDFAGLSWAPETDAFITASTSSENTAFYSIFKDPQRSATKWKAEMSAEDIEGVRNVVAGTRLARFLDEES